MSTRILVVDDDTALAEMIGIMLESEGHTPSFCADGAKAMDIFRQVEPDLVLLDFMLPSFGNTLNKGEASVSPNG